MKVHCVKKELEKGMLTVIRAVSLKTPLPILGHVKMTTEGEDKLILSATDLDIGIETSIKTTVFKPGSTTVPARIITEILTQLPDNDIVLEMDEEKQIMHLRCGKSKYDMHTLPAEDFPILPSPEEKKVINISQRELKSIVKNVAIAAASEEETRTILTGVLMTVEQEKILMVSTDGRRLAKADKKIETGVRAPFNIIIPSRAVFEISRILQDVEEPVKIIIGENQIFFLIDDLMMTSRLLEGQFPDYNQIIPKSFTHIITVNREKFITSLKRAMIMAYEKDKDLPRLIKFKIEGGMMVITSNTPELGQAYEEIELEEGSQDVSLMIAFNGRYILEGLNNLVKDKINLCISTPISPGLIKEEGEEDFTYLVMPVRLREEVFQEA
ncbi:MAG: DNA polymerase III subunit beta [bacterium]